MFEPLSRLFGADLMPHGYCLLWLPEILWLHVISDALITLACFVIPAALLHFVLRHRHEVPFVAVLLLFGAFITACGVTHAFGIWTIWHATYGIEGLFKLATALLAMTAALVMISILPKALVLPAPAELARVNRRLEREIAERRRVERELRRARDQLQCRVEQRTAALSAANEQLRKEVRERRQVEEQLRHLAQHDALTGLPNRVLLRDRLTQAMARADRERRRIAVMMLDLDNFKHVNDTLGHPIGDRLLRVVAERLSSGLRATDTVARLGGDEFAIVQTGLERIDGAAVLAQKLLDALGRPVEIDGSEVDTSASIGISVYPDDSVEPADLLARADMAMYRAKSEGQARYQFFAPEMVQAARRRKALEHDPCAPPRPAAGALPVAA
jgi:diguanylate cyclase (GGDEF)-like protein